MAEIAALEYQTCYDVRFYE